MTTTAALRILPYRDAFAADFDRLNRAWLVAGDFLEPADEVYLRAPREKIIEPGGEIFFAVDGDRVIGTAAAIPMGQGTFELAKLSVDPVAQGRGIGRQLTQHVIDFVTSHGASRLVLTSNTRLAAAVALYRALGFVEQPCPPGFGYVSADIYMELDITGTTPPVAGP
jgi:ribosomal protein S18 acetylase RimI-like enzyme